jgi:hypothetical protein
VALRETCFLTADLLGMRMRILLAVLALTSLPLAADDESGFDAPPPGTWQTYSPLTPLCPASFDYSGNECRITCPAPAPEVFSAYDGARGGLFAPTSMLDSAASVDITAWTPSADRNSDGIHMFVLTRVQGAIGLGSVTGYAASIIDMGANSGPNGNGRNGRLQIMLLYQEQAVTNFGQYLDFPLDPAKDYRLILVSRGNTHTARVFDLSSPATPLAELVVTDGTIPFPGRTGFLIYNDRLAPLDVTFDNFLAWDGSPPPLAIRAGTTPGTVEITSEFFRSLASDLTVTTDLGDAASWLPAAPVAVSRGGNQLVEVHPLAGPRRFFRRGSL